MLKLKKIAVTGGLSAGKTAVCQIFKELGAYIISADEIVHQLLSSRTPTAQQVILLLGSEILSGQTLDQSKIAAKVFTDPKLLTALEGILHPTVFDEIDKKYAQVSKEGKYTLFIAEVPLLYEANAQNRFDGVICVVADPKQCQNRFAKQMKKNYKERIQRQIPLTEKSSKADYIIENNSSFEELKNRVKTIYSQLHSEQGV